MSAAPARRSMGSNVVYSLLGNVIAPFTSLATAPILAHGLSVDGRGVLSAATAPLLLATAVGGFGLPEALIFHVARRFGATRSAVVRATVGLALLGALAAIAVFALAGPLSGGNAHLADLIQLTAVATAPTLLVLIPRSVAAGCHQWKLLAIERAVFGVLRLGWVVALFLTHGLTPKSATIALLVSPLLSALTFLPFLLRTWRSPAADLTADRVAWSDLSGFGLRIWLGALSGIVLTRMSAVLMVPLSSEFAAGLFAVAVTIGEIPLIISGAVRDVTFSADAAQGDDARLQQMARLTTFVTFVLSLGLAVTMPWWLPILFGRPFVDATAAALVVLAATVLGSTGSVAGAGLGARGRPGLRSWSMFVGAVANMSVLLLTVPVWGAVGGGWAMLAGNTVAGTLNVVWLNRMMGMPFASFYGVHREDLRLISSAVRRVTRGRGPARADDDAEPDLVSAEAERALHNEE